MTVDHGSEDQDIATNDPIPFYVKLTADPKVRSGGEFRARHEADEARS
jgi:hypothetical protein